MRDKSLRAALNCGFYQNLEEPDRYCPRCGSCMKYHALPGKSIEDLGYIVGSHPAWVALGVGE